ncbi:hypothetical protein PAPHI01_1107 [Pancytospora philotis]|nr:hypothetical protein PAPHI01_1107 [Pancytospora philotis]
MALRADTSIKAHVFREFCYAPSPITSITSNGATIAVFRRSMVLELVDSHTLKPFVRHALGFAVTSSGFLDTNTVVCCTACNKILLLDTATLEVAVHDVQALHIGVVYADAAFAERIFHFVNTRNELCLFKDGMVQQLLRESGPVSAMLACKGGVLLGTADGWVRMYDQGKRVGEVEVSGKVNQLCHFKNNWFLAVMETGAAALFDTETAVVFDTVPVRKNPLYAACIIGDVAHMSGQDSRIIAYKISNARFSKITQSDFHVSDVLSIAADNGRALTGGEDSVLVANALDNGRYTAKRVYDDAAQFGRSQSLFYATSGRSINFYKLEGIEQSTDSVAKSPSEYAGRMTFRITPDILEKVNQPQSGFPFFLKFNTTEAPVAVAVSSDEKYIAYSTSKETLLYDFRRGNRLCIEKVRAFGPAQQLVFSDKYLAVVERSKKVVVFSLESFRIIQEVPYQDFRERVAVVGDLLVMAGMKQIVNINNAEHIVRIGTAHPIGEVCLWDGAVTVLSYPPDRHSSLAELDISSGSLAEIPLSDDIVGCISHTDKNTLFSDRFLYVRTDERLRKYEIGAVVHAVVRCDDCLIIFQTAWSHLKQKFKPGVFKPKFSN